MNKLIANEKAYETLAAYLHGGRLPHALLVEGPAGSGKTTFAQEAAQGALCSAPREQRPCGQCRDCGKVEKGIHPDLLVFGGAGGSRSFHIDAVRALRQQAFIRPNEAACKVLLLENVQEMTVQAQNALLKIIEEPPRGVYFILSCENRAALLETIRSRVAVLALELPTVEQCQTALQALAPQASGEQLKSAAHRADGSIGRALAMLEAGEEGQDTAAEILYNACIGSELEALAALAKYERDRPGLLALLERMAALVGGTLLRPAPQGNLRLLADRAGRLRLMKILDIIEDTAQAVEQNANGLLLVTSLCARIRLALADS